MNEYQPALSEHTQIIIIAIGAVQTILLAAIGVWAKNAKTSIADTKSAVAAAGNDIAATKVKVEEAAADIAAQKAGLQEQRVNIGTLMQAELTRSAGPGSMAAISDLSADTHGEIMKLQQRIADLRQQDIAKTIATKAAEFSATLEKREGLGVQEPKPT